MALKTYCQAEPASLVLGLDAHKALNLLFCFGLVWVLYVCVARWGVSWRPEVDLGAFLNCSTEVFETDSLYCLANWYSGESCLPSTGIRSMCVFYFADWAISPSPGPRFLVFIPSRLAPLPTCKHP